MHFPKIGMLSKDVTEESGTGKAKKIEVINAAGEFYVESKSDEVDENNKAIYIKTFFEGELIEGIIVYHRKLLKMWDEANKTFIFTPLFDDESEVVPLFKGKDKINTGTPKQLQSLYPALTLKGKPTSDLKEITMLYVLKDEELYQMELSVSSGWEFSSYKRSVVVPATVTIFSSVEETFGTNTYRKMVFKSKGNISAEQFEVVKETVQNIKDSINAEKEYFNKSTPLLNNVETISDAEFVKQLEGSKEDF